MELLPAAFAFLLSAENTGAEDGVRIIREEDSTLVVADVVAMPRLRAAASPKVTGGASCSSSLAAAAEAVMLAKMEIGE